MFEMTTEKVFHADDKYVLRLLIVVIHEHQFKRKENTTIPLRQGGVHEAKKASGSLYSKLEVFI